ncbi:MAG: phosphatidylserine/phosphatidylglycerophosphate/cardiolipin synthase family protein [Akkermansiaceae bacterium]
MVRMIHQRYKFLLLTTLIGLATASCNPGSRIANAQPIDESVKVGSPKFSTAVSKTTGVVWARGNSVESLLNGDGFYPPMLKAIREAKKTINFETYAYVDGNAARAFNKAFCAKAREGVKVKIILDRIGSKAVGKAQISKMRAAGIDVRFYNRWSIFKPWQLNTRDHRKIMVVDGKIGFTGGCGVADAWIGNAHSKEHWRENHYRVTGPVVAQLQRAFEDNWRKLGGTPLVGNDYYPTLKKRGAYRAQAFNSAPIEKEYTIPHFYRQAFAAAQESIVIENAYILLDRPMMKSILDARKRGVHVEMIVPAGYNDAWVLRYLSRYQYEKLLRAGVHIYEYQPTMMHCKVLVIDGVFSSVGSANMDPRSLYLNDESNLNVISRRFAEEQLRIIENDKKNSKRITHAPSRWNPLTMPTRAAAMLLFPHL